MLGWLIVGIIVLFGFVVFFGAPYVPSKRRELAVAFTELRPLTVKDVLLDLGSGDGVVLRSARKHGAGQAIGYELNPVLVAIANWLSRMDDQVVSQLANMWHRPFPDDVTVIYLFSEARDIKRVVQRLETEAARIGRVVDVVSYGFTLPGHTHTHTVGAYYLYRLGA